ncbi:hypothetical protein Tco_1566419, partial [Tanacetum coccineum]
QLKALARETKARAREKWDVLCPAPSMLKLCRIKRWRVLKCILMRMLLKLFLLEHKEAVVDNVEVIVKKSAK